MNNTTLRDGLITQADGAFMKLAKHINDLLDAADFYCKRYPVVTVSDQMKAKDLSCAVKDLALLLNAVAGEVGRWKKEEDRVISKMGVEIDYLNELYATIEASLLFFLRENIYLENFSLSEVKQAHAELTRCNRLL